MSDRDQQRTEAYADQQVRELLALEELARHAPDPDRDELGADATELLADLHDVHGEDAPDDPVGAWLSDALDVWLTAELNLFDGEVRAVRDLVVLTGTGGPHVEVFAHGDEELTVCVAWWGTTARRRAAVPRVAGVLDGLADDAARGTR